MWVIAVFLVVQGLYTQVHLTGTLHQTEAACLHQLDLNRTDIEYEARSHLLSDTQQIHVQCILLDMMKPERKV